MKAKLKSPLDFFLIKNCSKNNSQSTTGNFFYKQATSDEESSSSSDESNSTELSPSSQNTIPINYSSGFKDETNVMRSENEESSSQNNQASTLLVPYTLPNNEPHIKTVRHAQSNTLYGFQPGKWRARARKTRISHSSKPIEVLRKKRIYLRHHHNDMVIESRNARQVFKYCTNTHLDVTARFTYPPTTERAPKEHFVVSPYVTNVEFFVDSYSDKAVRQLVLHQLKRVKKVKSCFVLLGSLRSLNFLNNWRKLESLRIKCGMEWTLDHWKCLTRVVKPNLDCLSLNIRLMIESIKGEQYLECLKRIGKSSINTLNLKLELQSEHIIDYLFVRTLCLSKVKNLHLRCIGNTVMTDRGVLTYEFQGLLNQLMPKSLASMKTLLKLKLDFSNDFFVYYRMEDYQLFELSQALQRLPELQLLDLNFSNGCERANKVTDNALYYLEECLGKLKNLQMLKLNVSNTYITEDGLEKFCKFVMSMEMLHYFRINASRNSIDKTKLEEALIAVRDKFIIYCDIIV